MHFVLTSSRVESFERITAASARSAEVEGSRVVSKLEDLLTLDGKLLVALYNLAANEPESHAHPVTRFSDGATAAKRTWPVIEYLAKPGTIPASPETPTTLTGQEYIDMAAKKKAKKVKALKVPGVGRPSKAFSGKFIYKLAKENPRRAGTLGFKAWELITNGMAYEKYLEAGGENKHLAWDVDHKFAEVRSTKG